MRKPVSLPSKMCNMHTCRLSATAAMSEQPQIAAVDERNSGFDKGDGGVTQRRCLPRFAIDARRAVDGNGDLAIGGAVHTTIGGAQPQSKAATLIDGHAGVTRQRTFEHGTRKPYDCVDWITETARSESGREGTEGGRT